MDAKYAKLIEQTKASRFRAGESGNPGGKPKIKSLSKAYRSQLEEVNPSDPAGRSFAECIAETMIKLAVKGHVSAAIEICDRCEGRRCRLNNSNPNLTESDPTVYRESLVRELWIQAAKRTKRARSRLADFVCFTKLDFRMGWFHVELCRLLEEFLSDVIAKRSPRLMLFAPPQHGKSELISRRFPAYALG